MMKIDKILSITVILIGLYMVFAFNGGGVLNPPVLSGLAFAFIGIRGMLRR